MGGPSAQSESGSDSERRGIPALRVAGLTTQFHTPDGIGRAVDDVSFEVYPGETLGIVGESGCGKSITALSVLRLVPSPPGHIVGGTIEFGGRDLRQISDRDMRDVRGNDISMIFQEPMTSLNPVLTIGYQIAEAVRRHEGVSRREARARAVAMLDLVRIPEAAKRAGEFPHQLSGGMRQRAMIAMALSCNPQVLIADEPTTALDVTIQAQVLSLIADLQQRMGTAVLLITHDLGVIAETADRVIVMYAGRKVEEASVAGLFARPQHPYTRGLLASVPRLGLGDADAPRARLTEIPGIVPALTELGQGCAFAPRCVAATEQCFRDAPVLRPAPIVAGVPAVAAESTHLVACWHPGVVVEGNEAPA